MISEFEVENIRLFEGPGWRLRCPRITVLCGTNSSGKSTLLKALLVLRQTQGIGEGFESLGGELRLNGRQVDLGTYESCVSHRKSTSDMSIGMTIEDVIDDLTLRRLQLLGAGSSPDAISPSRTTKMVPYSLKALFRFGLIHDPRVRESRSNDQSPFLKAAHFELRYKGQRILDWVLSLTPSPAGTERSEIKYRLQLPVNFFRSLGMQRIDVKIKETDQYAIFETYLKGLLPQGILGRIKKDEKGRSAQAPRRQYSIWPIPHPLDGAFIDFQGALAGIHYLGPLRTAAERFYIAQSATDPGMDSAGEFLPYVLRDRRDSPVVFCAPGTAGTTTESFQRALDIWLSYIRTGQKPSSRAAAGEISLESTKGVLVEVGVRSPGGEAHSLVDSGFGYSQVMPILARGLLAPNTSTLIVEQPELHLNPALQARLAEFFVGLARCGKQVIIETHSEHILNAMRVLAAETDKPIESAIYFVDVATGRPIIHQLEIKEDGTVANWPAEFFGEADELRARLLKAQRRFLGSDHRQE